MITVDYIDDWAARLRSRLYEQFKNKITWEGFITLLSRQFQDLEDAAQTMFDSYDIDASEGAQLDVIGRIVGQTRVGTSDATYRTYLKARILANNSDSTATALYGIANALLGAMGFIITVSPVRAFALRVIAPITRAQALALRDFIAVAKMDTATAVVEWQESTTSALFLFNGTAAQGFNAGVFAGALNA